MLLGVFGSLDLKSCIALCFWLSASPRRKDKLLVSFSNINLLLCISSPIFYLKASAVSVTNVN